MKKITAILICSCIIFCMAGPSMAADGINAHEQALLNKFTSTVYRFAAEHESVANVAAQYISVATNVLMQVDLDAQACADLSAVIDAAVSLIETNGWESAAEIAANSGSILATVNTTSQEYGMTVGVDVGGDEYASVTFMTDQGEKTVGGSTKPPVNQTGMDFSVTAAVFGALLAAIAAGISLTFKKRLLSR